MNYSLPGSSVHGISQARMLEWIAISFTRVSSWPRNQTSVSCSGTFFTTKPQEKPHSTVNYTQYLLITYQFSSVQSLNHVRLFVTPWTAACWPPCPSSAPGACSNSCPLSWWCHPTISSSVIPFSSHLQSFPASGSFKWVSSLHQVAKELEFQLQHQSFQWIFRTDFL